MNIDSRGGLGYIVSGWYIIAPPDGTLLLRRLHKSKEGQDKEFILISGRQWHLARKLNQRGQGNKYWIYVVNNAGKESAKATKICNPIEQWKDDLLYAHPINIKL